MIGLTRMYVEPQSILPSNFVPPTHQPVIDCEPAEALALRRELRHQGYEVLTVSL